MPDRPSLLPCLVIALALAPIAAAQAPAPATQPTQKSVVFPNDVPLPPDASATMKVEAVEPAKAPAKLALTFPTAGASQDVLQWYKTALEKAGWSVAPMKAETESVGVSHEATKEGRKIKVVVAKGADEKSSTCALYLEPAPVK